MLLKEKTAKVIQYGSAVIQLILLSLILVSVNSFAAPLLSINNSAEEISLRPFIDIIAEEKSVITDIEALLEKENQYRFTPLPANPSIDVHKSVWVRVAIENKTPKQKIMWLAFNLPGRNLAQAAAYFPDTKNILELDSEEGAARLISLQPGQRAIYFFMLSDIAPNKIKPFLYAPEYYSQKLVKDKQWLNYGLYAFLVFPIFVFFLFSVTKEKAFAYLAFYSLSIAGLAIISANDFWRWFSLSDRLTGSLFYTIFYIAYLMNILSIHAYLEKQITGKQYRKGFIINGVVIGLFYIGFIIFIGSYHPIIWLPALVGFMAAFGALAHCYMNIKDASSGFLISSHAILVSLLLLVLYFNLDIKDLSIFLSPEVVVLFTIEFICFFMAYYWGYRKKMVARHLQQKQQIRTTTELFEKYRNALKQTSHNIRTPINAINNAVEEMKRSPLSNGQRDALNNIYFSGQNILDQASDLLHRTGFNNSDDNTLAPFEIRYLIEECFASVQEHLVDKSIEIVCDIDESISSIVEGNAFFVRQTLTTLIRHSIASTQEGIIQVKVYPSDKKQYLSFSVSDTGRGLDQRAVNEIMQAKVSDAVLDSLPSDHLQLVMSLLQQLDSKLEVASKIGDGNEFSYSLLLPTSKLSNDIEPKDSTALNDKKMLIVDDNQIFCRTLKQQASNWGVKAMQSHDGAEAIALFRAKKNADEGFDFIVIDDDLPYMSGMEVATKIMAESDVKPLIILLCTPANVPTPQQYKQAGVDVVLTKPISQRILHSTLFNYIELSGVFAANTVTQQKIRVLVAEDNDVSRRVVGKMLTVLGVDFKLVSDGQLALEACTRERFGLILMDCEMPIMDGFKATEMIHQWQNERGQELTPIYALTAHVSDENRDRAFASGMIGFLEKPVQMEEVNLLLDKHADHVDKKA